MLGTAVIETKPTKQLAEHSRVETLGPGLAVQITGLQHAQHSAPKVTFTSRLSGLMP
jgi:hypothetical protein